MPNQEQPKLDIQPEVIEGSITIAGEKIPTGPNSGTVILPHGVTDPIDITNYVIQKIKESSEKGLFKESAEPQDLDG